MSTNTPFSKRMGINNASVPITVRCDAPKALRGYLFLLIQPYIESYKTIRNIVCTCTMTAPDRGNWGENEFMKQEIISTIEQCPWNNVYDILERVYSQIYDQTKRKDYEQHVNEFFQQKGIGWKMKDGLIEFRGDDTFEEEIQSTSDILAKSGLKTSASEIKEAIADLSHKPNPDITGAIQHSMAALECVAREVCGSKETLGQLIKHNTDIVPSPLNNVISTLFGYASENGRHLKEGKMPNQDEAELIVHLSASLCSYLTRKSFAIRSEEEIDDLPF